MITNHKIDVESNIYNIVISLSFSSHRVNQSDFQASNTPTSNVVH